MNQPTVIAPQRSYHSKSDGNAQAYYFDVPFASMVKHITLDLHFDYIDATGNGTKVVVTLEQSLLRDLPDDSWIQVGSAVFQTTSDAYLLETTAVEFGAIVRVKLTIEEDVVTPSVPVSADLSIRASGKPF